ncbi:MAG: hypothetical protein HY767_04190 [Candidatus Omnitrophica bacterium]|nr:hypothetical protein [Candidatus Omnitrophota bacterium]
MNFSLVVWGIIVIAIGTLMTGVGWNWDKFQNQSKTTSGIKANIRGDNNVVAGGNITVQKTMESSREDLERQKNESDPKAKISLERTPGEVLIKICAEKNVLTLALDIPILGKIINIHDYNSVTDAETRSKRIVGENSSTSSNNVELLIENIKPTKKLSYKILFSPLPRNVFVAGTDRYQISYTWKFAGNTFSKNEWISLQTGNPIDEPQVQVKGFNVIKRALSPDEIRKRYEEGFKRRTVE